MKIKNKSKIIIISLKIIRSYKILNIIIIILLKNNLN